MIHHTAAQNWPLGIVILLVVIVLLILAFEVWMLVSAVINKNISTERKLLWIIGMFLLHPFVAIAYYFTDHKKRQAK